MPDTPSQAGFRQRYTAGLARYGDLAKQVAATGANARAVQEQAKAAAVKGDTSLASQLAAQAGDLRNKFRDLADSQHDLGRQLGNQFGESGDPCDLSVGVPLLLLPVRLETRFFPAADGKGQVLKVRIFPDAVHIDTLRRKLTPEEQAAGAEYWSTGASDAGWSKLVAMTGEKRAAWVADRTRPGAPPIDDDQLGAVARMLPHRFQVSVTIGKTQLPLVTGKPITVPPMLSLFGEHDDADDVELVNNVPVSKAARWIVDFDAAEALGMAVTVPLAPTTTKIDSVLVFGVRDESGAASAKGLDRLLESHRYGSGLGFVRPGTPTNNVGAERSGWTPAPMGKPDAAVPAAKGNRALLSQALGIAGAALAGIDGDDADFDGDARASNALLWWPTWGDFLEKLDVDTPDGRFLLTDAQRDAVRKIHRDMVRGRGPYPSIRIGGEPYGIVPIGLTADPAWTAAPGDGQVLAAVRGARSYWTEAVYSIPRVGGGTTPDKTIAAMQGMSAVSFGVRARAAAVEGMTEGAEDDAELGELLDALVLEDFYDKAQGKITTHKDPIDPKHHQFILQAKLVLSKETKPIPLPYAHDSDPAVLKQIAAGKTPAKLKSVLQALAALARADVAKKKAGNPLDKIPLYAPFDTGLGGLTAETLSAASAGGSAGLFALAAENESLVTTSATYRKYQPVARGAVSYSDLALTSTNAAARAEFAQLGAYAGIYASGVHAEVQESLAHLAGASLSTEDRAILVAEALDIASHRYDAWATALAAKRAATLRAKAATGIHIGAFGYVENIAKGTTEQYGFIHAPGLTHAATAGVLRSAYLAHKKEGAEGVFAIDLSSRRVRTAMDLIDARRSGQSLAESLGYRIERALQDTGLSRIIRNLRGFAPLKGAAPGTPQPDGVAAETIGAGNIVDGVKLIETFRAKGIGPIKDAASQSVSDNPYLSGPFVGVQPSEEAGLTTAIQNASEAMDAVADLLMAESVHQLVLGNPARASAALDAASSGHSLVPEPAVIATPTSTRMLSHRVILSAAAVSGPAWPGGSNPRAVAAPELEGWVALRLGSAASIVVGTGANGALVTLANAGLCALDFVYSAGARFDLEARLRVKLGLAAGFAFAETRNAAWPAGSIAFDEAIAGADALRAVLARARPAEPRDFGIPHADPPPARSVDVATAVSRLKLALATFEARLATLTGTGAPGSTVAATLASLPDFGIAEPHGLTDAEDLHRFAESLKARRDACVAALGTAPDAAAVAAAGQALFGEGFWVLPPIAPPKAGDLWLTSAAPAKPSRLRRWLADLASVRTALGYYSDSLLVSAALGKHAQLSAVQLAVPGAETVTSDFAGDSNPDGIAVVALIESSGPAGAPAVALILDEFNEPLSDLAPRTSAVAFNAPSPGARPPQAWLLAVPPDAARWTSDTVRRTILEAFELAKMRGVTLERALLAPRMLPATYVQSWSLQGEEVLDWSGLSAEQLFGYMSFVKDAK